MTFNDFLTELTKTHSYRKIARQTGLSPSTIMRICRGMVKPDYETVERIVGVFGGWVEIRKGGDKMIDTTELVNIINTAKWLDDLINDGFYVTINKTGMETQSALYIVSVSKQVREDEFIEDEITSMTLNGAVLKAWERYINF